VAVSFKKKLGVKFRRQHPIKKYIVDFYCHAGSLIIELDGGIHNSKSQREYDENREFELIEFGLEIIRFTNDEVLHNLPEVLEKIKSRIHLDNKNVG
jgi:very-short-patch-repair endonuclease